MSADILYLAHFHVTDFDLQLEIDADDYMHKDRVESQYHLSQQSHLLGDFTLVGSNFVRFPAESTPFYTEWLNQLTPREMLLQQYRECTIICPSWFYCRDIYSRVRNLNGMGFIEKDPNLGRVPEDLIFFLDHLFLGGGLAKVERPLVTYRYVHTSWSIGTKALDLQRVRIKYLQEKVLSTWSSFSIYGGGFDAKKFINLLTPENAKKVMMFGDIAPKRLATICIPHVFILLCCYLPSVLFMDLAAEYILILMTALSLLYYMCILFIYVILFCPHQNWNQLFPSRHSQTHPYSALERPAETSSYLCCG